MIPNLKFKLQSKNRLISNCKKTNFIKRFLARQMAISIFNDYATHYQFGGWSGLLKKEYNTCLADKFQLMHWILFNAGYSCCTADIMKRCGIDYQEWEKQHFPNNQETTK